MHNTAVRTSSWTTNVDNKKVKAYCISYILAPYLFNGVAYNVGCMALQLLKTFFSIIDFGYPPHGDSMCR